MIGGSRPISLTVSAEGNAASSQAVSIGLIVTELVINALKHAFPENKIEGRVTVSHEVDGTNWKLVVSNRFQFRPLFASNLDPLVMACAGSP